MSNVVPFTGGKRCIVCNDQIDPLRVRANPDVATCNAGCGLTMREERVAETTQQKGRDTLSL